jgi:hypothetical protein
MTRTISEHRRLCGRAKGRADLVIELEGIALRTCSTLTVTTNRLSPRALYVTLSRGPYRCSITLDGASRVGAFLGHWWIESNPTVTYPPGFIAGTVNPHHHRKATTVRASWYNFSDVIVEGLEALPQLQEATP